MNEETKGSADAGSSDELIKGDPATLSGESSKLEEKSVPEAQYKELESKLGSQGEELGKFRNFFQEIQPLLDKLQTQPEVVEAVLSGKIDTKLAQAVSEGKVKIEDATMVAQAHDEVKKDLGKKDYEKMSGPDLEKLIKEKAEQIISEKIKSLENKVDQNEERKAYEDSVKTFLENTPDYHVYAEGVKEWLEDHPDQYDIEIAYNAVKGKILTNELSKKAEEDAAEEAKRLAAGGGMGGSQGGSVIKDKEIIDELISSRTNPNIF